MKSRNYRFFTSLLTLMAVVGTEAQTAPEVPRLVVNIVIDQLRTDYLEAFSPLYGEKGFLRLMKEGRMYTQAEYPFSNPDRASSIACLMSGTSPYENGIVGERWLDRQTLQPIHCVDDKECAAYGSSEGTSPKNFGVSTLGDELKVATGGAGIVYSVSPCRDAAVLLSGHASNGAFWLSEFTGNWCGSSYYGEFPKWASDYNSSKEALGKRIDKITWEPANEMVGKFKYFVVSGEAKKAFKHEFSGERRFVEYKASACVNEEVNHFISHLIKSVDIGLDEVTDMLNVSYYAGNYDHKPVTECPMELQDTYVRLDRDVAELIDMLETRVGQGKVLYVLTSTGSAEPDDLNDLSKYKIPSGSFSISKAQLLLNMYLIAVYGQGQYVETCFGNELFLDHKLIENRNLNMTEVLERSSDFLIQLSGVRDIYTSERLSLGAWTPGISKLRNAYNPKCSGDIFIQVSPGWTLENENTHERTVSRESYMGFPLFFFGCNVKSEKVVTPVSIDRVAPTLAQSMRIRAPNACSLAPLNY